MPYRRSRGGARAVTCLLQQQFLGAGPADMAAAPPPGHLGLGGEADIGITVAEEADQRLLVDLTPILAAIGAVADTGEQAGAARPFEQLCQTRLVQLVAQ